MNRRFAAVLLVLAGACTDPNFKPPVAFQADFAPVTGQVISGSIAAVSQGRATEAGLNLRQGQAGQVVGWEIRFGTCATSGERYGGRGAYPDLTFDGAGAASVERTFINDTMDEDARYHGVVVNAADRSVVLSCANLVRVQF